MGDLFDLETGKQVYYVVGFFCDAGANEAERRSTKNDIGECIKSLDSHFATGNQHEKLATIVGDLPNGLIGMVDERNNFGGLKYPDMQLYNAFAVVEKVYSSLATSSNFVLFGGMLLEKICAGIIDNQIIRSLFFELFDGEKYTEHSVLTTMRYYLKVFNNCRAKDICYRMNSNIYNGSTVGLRQTLAAGGVMGDVKIEDCAELPRRKNLSTKLTTLRLRVGGRLQPKRIQVRLTKLLKKNIGIGKEGKKAREYARALVEGRDPDPDSDTGEPEVSSYVQHNALQLLANGVIDVEDYNKECGINADTEKYMEE